LATNSYLTPVLTRVPTATIVYDLVAFDPETPPPLRSRMVERLALRAAVTRSAALLAISQATADALAARVPAAAAKTTVMPLGVSPALTYADPNSVEAIAGELERVLTDPEARATLAARGPERAARFSWAASAEVALATLTRIARLSSPR